VRGTGESTVTEAVRVPLVERTYSDDEQNRIILVFATLDGEQAYRKERALTSFTGPAHETPVSLEVDPDDLSDVSDPARRERFASEAIRKADEHDPGDALRVSLQQEGSPGRWIGGGCPCLLEGPCRRRDSSPRRRPG